MLKKYWGQLSMDLDKHSILQHVNNPAKILFWELDEGLSFLLPFGLLCMTGSPVVGVLVALVTFNVFKWAKVRLEGGIAQLKYWYLPSLKKDYSCYVKSYVVEWFI